MFPIDTPLLFAHRGASAELPENTLPAFARALELGADVLELDVHLSADGHLMVFHDLDGKRLVGIHDAIASTPRARIEAWRVRGPHETQASVPALDDVLTAFPKALLNVDLKPAHPACVPAFLALLAQHDAGARVTGASFSGRHLTALRAQGHRGPTCLSRGEVMAARLGLVPSSTPAAPRRAQVPTHVGPLRLVNAAFVARLTRARIACDVWTVDDPAHAQELLDLGVQGIMTNDPRALAPVIAGARATRTTLSAEQN